MVNAKDCKGDKRKMTDDVIPLNEIGKIGTVKVYNQAYVDKQQKRIEELEKENAEAKERIKTLEYRCENIKDTDTMELVALQKENANVKEALEGYKKIAKWCDKCDKIADLEKENAELKENCNSLQELVTYYQTNFCQE